MCGYASHGPPSYDSDTHNNLEQNDHKFKTDISTIVNDFKKDNLEEFSDLANVSDFSKTETVENPLWDGKDDSWMLKVEEDYWPNNARANNTS